MTSVYAKIRSFFKLFDVENERLKKMNFQLNKINEL